MASAGLATSWLVLARFRTLAVLAAAAGLAAPALAATKLPKLLGNNVGGQTELLVKPAEIIYTGDGTGILGGSDGGKGMGFGHLKWTRWDDGLALGSGADWIDNCMPSCAGGTYSPHAATVKAFRPRDGHFTRLTLQTTYRGKPVVNRLSLERAGGNLIYEFVSPGS